MNSGKEISGRSGMMGKREGRRERIEDKIEEGQLREQGIDCSEIILSKTGEMGNQSKIEEQFWHGI